MFGWYGEPPCKSPLNFRTEVETRPPCGLGPSCSTDCGPRLSLAFEACCAGPPAECMRLKQNNESRKEIIDVDYDD